MRTVKKYLRLIDILSTSRRTKEEICDRLQIEERTFYRYINELRNNLGMEVINKDFKYYIPKGADDTLKPRFSEEEVTYIKSLMSGRQSRSPLSKSVLSKLHQHSSLQALVEANEQQRISEYVQEIEVAIKTGQQLRLIKYHSSHSSTVSDRIVDPLALEVNYSYLRAYEAESGIVKSFRLERLGGVALLDSPVSIPDDIEKASKDIFGMEGGTAAVVSWMMTLRAHSLLREEYAGVSQSIEKLDDNSYRFSCTVNAWEGVGRFVLGLPGEIWDIRPQAFVAYLAAKMGRFGKKGDEE
ncbi:MAG: WYL domain-containing protein [Cyclobacteriaceae bacterium]|nr:WYL domain-containing protein [Cyclobacteriaceae bacterium]MCH8515412.1 WYL domain-containing protein [Cyclobacteriaceae bacterium]